MLRFMPWREAARVDAAVQRFAETGEGDLEWVKGSRANYRLLVPGYGILIELDAEAHVLDVWSVTRRSA
jgi:hypothetical protein